MESLGVKQKSLSSIRTYRMLREGDDVLVGLSGGADSVTLLHLLLQLRGPLGLSRIRAVHINHGLRGEEADRDEAFARVLCEQMMVPLDVFRVDIGRLAAEEGKGLEETGRKERYALFEQVASREGMSRIATAHTLSDNLETVLFRLCRGSGLRGLSGIPPVRGKIIRPLIDCSREEIEQYCKVNGLSFVTDTSNSDLCYARNRLRSLVIPPLMDIHPGLLENVRRMTGQLRQADAYLAAEGTKALQKSRQPDGRYETASLRRLPDVVRLYALRQMAEERGLRCEERHLYKMDWLLSQAGALTLSKHCRIVSDGRRIELEERREGEEQPAPMELPVDLRCGEVYELGNQIWAFRLVEGDTVENGSFAEEYFFENAKIHNLFFNCALDYDKIKKQLFFRWRRPGDVFCPFGRGVTKSLKKLFNEAGLPVDVRVSLPLLCDSEGIVFIPGFGPAQRVSCGPETRRFLAIYGQEAVRK